MDELDNNPIATPGGVEVERIPVALQPVLQLDQGTAEPKPVLLLPPAQPRFELAALKKYTLRGKPVVWVEDISVPAGLKQYRLKGKPVLRLADLEAAIA